MDPQPVPVLTDPSPHRISRGVVVVSRGERLLDDLAFAAEIGLTHVRLDAPWARAQPKAAIVDGGVIEELVAALTAARDLGLEPWLRLLPPDLPHWFLDEGGFTDPATAARWWPRWVETVAERVGDIVGGWVPLAAPFGLVTRFAPTDARQQGEIMHTLIVAWRDAWRILRGGPPVATALDVAGELPTGPTQEHLDDARRRERMRWNVWLDGLLDGTVRIPGRGPTNVPDLAGACDVLGIAVREQVGSALHRCAEQGPVRPLAVTFALSGSSDSEAAQAVTKMRGDLAEVTSSLTITAVTASPFVDDPDHPDRLGLATASRRLKDAGEAFVAPP